MTETRFLQIHSLHSYAAALLNRDDTGLAKRLQYGGVSRTRISSQCLKRHWRLANDIDEKGRVIRDDPHAIQHIADYVESVRSRDLVNRSVFGPLKNEFPEDVLEALLQWFEFAVYSGKSDDKPRKRGQVSKTDEKRNRQTLLLGGPELQWLSSQVRTLAKKSDGDPDKAFGLGEEWVGLKKKGKSDFQNNIAVLRENCALPGGLAAALFGRMVTSDPAANIEAPVHVAHAFTIHGEESDGDYFTAVDDLKREEDDSGADTIQETELTSGLFYGYVVIDLPGLIANCGGDRDLAARVVHNLVYLIAEVSPGAKLGSTAPYGRAGFMLLEAGDRQPRSLAEAFRKPARPDLDDGVEKLAAKLAAFDKAYQTGESRICLNLSESAVEGIAGGSLVELAGWAQARASEAKAGDTNHD